MRIQKNRCPFDPLVECFSISIVSVNSFNSFLISSLTDNESILTMISHSYSLNKCMLFEKHYTDIDLIQMDMMDSRFLSQKKFFVVGLMVELKSLIGMEHYFGSLNIQIINMPFIMISSLFQMVIY